MKTTLLSVTLCLLLVACGSDETTTNDTETLVSASAGEGNRQGLLQIPDGDLLEEGYEAILEKADVDDPELMEVHLNFSKSISELAANSVTLSVQLVSPKDKNKLVEYEYDFNKKQVDGPTEVTITTGLGSTEKFIDTYDGFKQALFKKEDIMDFEKADEVYEQAIAKSGYESKDCYVQRLDFEYDAAGKLDGYVSVQSTRSITANKSFSVDKEGNVKPD